LYQGLNLTFGVGASPSVAAKGRRWVSLANYRQSLSIAGRQALKYGVALENRWRHESCSSCPNNQRGEASESSSRPFAANSLAIIGEKI